MSQKVRLNSGPVAEILLTFCDIFNFWTNCQFMYNVLLQDSLVIECAIYIVCCYFVGVVCFNFVVLVYFINISVIGSQVLVYDIFFSKTEFSYLHNINESPFMFS